jgi:hypothetical protein
MKNKKTIQKFILLSIIAIAISACSPSGPKIVIEDAWIRPDPLWENAAGYFTVTNEGGEGDTLLSISISISSSESMHQTTMEGEIHKMLAVEELEIGPGESVSFMPLSYHVMMMNIDEGLDYGQLAPMIFTFEKSGEIEIQAQIKAEK